MNFIKHLQELEEEKDDAFELLLQPMPFGLASCVSPRSCPQETMVATETVVAQRRNNWDHHTANTDVVILTFVARHGGKWRKLARLFNNNWTDDVVRNRYLRLTQPCGGWPPRRRQRPVAPPRTTPWTAADDEQLLALFKLHGRRWSRYAIPGRSLTSIRNRANRLGLAPLLASRREACRMV